MTDKNQKIGKIFSTKQFKRRQNVKTKFGTKSIVRECVQKGTGYTTASGIMKRKMFKKILKDLFVSQHEKILFNSNAGAIKSFIYRKKSMRIILNNVIFLNKVDWKYICCKYI